MGSNYIGANSDCYHCSGCGTYRPCDDCSASCCQNNMSSHRELRRLEDRFREEVNQARKNVRDRCVSVVEELRKYYNIRIYYDEYNDYLEQSRHIIQKLESRKDYIKRQANSVKEDTFVKERLNNLKDRHKNIMDKIRNEFEYKAKKFKMESEEIKRLNEEIEKKQNIKYNLREERDKIKYKKSSKEIFKKQQENKFYNEYLIKKNEIDLKYSYLENISYPIKEYSQQEKDLKNALLKKIRRIKNYPIPECIMQEFGLMNYLY